MGDDRPFFVDDEDVPGAVCALRGVVMLDRSVPSIRVVALNCLIHEYLRVCCGVCLYVDVPLVPSRAEDQTIAPHDPAVLALVLVVVRRVDVHVIDPATIFIRGKHVHAEVVTRDVRPQGTLYVLAYVGGHSGMDDDIVVLVDDEDVPIAVDALRSAVVVDHGLAAGSIVELNGPVDECLGVCAGFTRLGRAVLVPSGAEDEPVVAHDPGVLRTHFARRVWEPVVDPSPSFNGTCGDNESVGVAVRVSGLLDIRSPSRGEEGVRDEEVVFVDDVHVPVAVNALLRVVVIDCSVPSKYVVEVDGAVHESFGIGGGVFRLGGAVLVPSGAEDEAVVPHDPGVLRSDGARRVLEFVVDPTAVCAGGCRDHESMGVAVGALRLLEVGSSKRGDDGMGEEDVVFVDDVHVPVAIHALRCVVVCDRRFAAIAVVAFYCVFHVGLGKGGGVVFGSGLDIPLVPSGAEDQTIAPHDPAVLALVLAFVRRVDVHVIDPAPIFVRGKHVHAEVVTRDVRPQRTLDVLAYVGGHSGVDDDLVVLVDDEDVPITVDALWSAVVVERDLAAGGVVEVYRTLHEHLGVLAGLARLGRTVFIPSGAEEQPVVLDDPGVLELHGVLVGVWVDVVDPPALFGGGVDDRKTERVAVRACLVLDVAADESGDGCMGYYDIILVDDEDVPIAVHALWSVVVCEGGLAPIGSIAVYCFFHERLGVGGRAGCRRTNGTGEPL